MIIPIILCGGSGTRLWPLSRKLYPKQFISLINDTTLFQDTILRLPDYLKKPLLVCNEEHRFFVAEQLREIDKLGTIILEPVARDTAPAISLSDSNPSARIKVTTGISTGEPGIFATIIPSSFITSSNFAR